LHFQIQVQFVEASIGVDLVDQKPDMDRHRCARDRCDKVQKASYAFAVQFRASKEVMNSELRGMKKPATSDAQADTCHRVYRLEGLYNAG
jgi:hypothetical protein